MRTFQFLKPCYVAGVIAFLALTLGSVVHAHQLFYVMGGVGKGMYDSSTDDSSSFVGSVDEDVTAWTVGLGVNINEYFSVEAGYVDLDELDYDGLWLGTPDRGKVETDGWEFALVGKLPVNQEHNINLLGKVGVFAWDSDEKEVFGGVPEPKNNEDGEDLMYGFGIQGRVMPGLDLRLEWNRYTDVADDDIDSVLLRAIWSF